MKNTDSEPMDPFSLRVIIVGTCSVLILSLIYLLDSSPASVTIDRKYDVVFELKSPDVEASWTSIKNLFGGQYSDGSITANVTEENVSFSDYFYETAKGDLGRYGYELRFRSVVSPNGAPARSRLDLVHASREEKNKNVLILEVTNLTIEDGDSNVPPENGGTIYNSISSASRKDFEPRLKAIGITEPALLQPVLKVDQKRRRLKFKDENSEVLSVAMDESSAAHGEKRASDVRITVQPNSRRLDEASEDDFKALLDFARNVNSKLLNGIPNLRVTQERLSEKLLRELK